MGILYETVKNMNVDYTLGVVEFPGFFGTTNQAVYTNFDNEVGRRVDQIIETLFPMGRPGQLVNELDVIQFAGFSIGALVGIKFFVVGCRLF